MRWVPDFCEDLKARSAPSFTLLGELTGEYPASLILFISRSSEGDLLKDFRQEERIILCVLPVLSLEFLFHYLLGGILREFVDKVH